MAIDEELSALMDRFVRAVSFDAGGRPAYERLHDLFTPAGRLINAIGDTPDDTTVAGFIEPRRAVVDAGALTSFEEVETGAVTESFGKVAGGWRITSMAWDDEA